MANVLVVDDEPDICELVRLTLEMDGHAVAMARDGATALALLDENRPDLVLLDVMMPEVDGWEVLRRIKSAPDEQIAHLPVLMLTARADDLDRVRGGIEGAIRYLTKPFSLDELRGAVDEALAGEPEPVKRRKAQHAALEQLARIEKGQAPDRVALARPRLTRFEVAGGSPAGSRQERSTVDVSSLSPKQVELLAAVAKTRTVRDAADQLAVSRSNVYASLRRIARKLDIHSVPELVLLARNGAFGLGAK
jgi:DNA-binding response OmpR family regulator